MVLKEAYRYQNFLSESIDKAEQLLLRKDFYLNIKEVHHRKKTNPDAGEDETVIAEKPFTCSYGANDVINFLVKAIDEKEKLSDAIADVKRDTEIDIDSSISINKIKQALVSRLERMDSERDYETKSVGTDYKFNADGNQVPYNYEVTKVITIDFDRNNVRKLIQKYNKETDEISEKLDLLEVTTEVDFTPAWNVHDSLDALVESCMSDAEDK